MPLFKFKVAAHTGTVSEILVEGDNEPDALSRVRRRGLMPMKNLGRIDGHGQSGIGCLLRPFDAVAFTNRLAPLLAAHIPLERALCILAEGMEVGSRPRAIVSDLRRGLHEGRKLSELIREHGKAFPPVYANLVEAGEESGALPEVIQELRRFLNERRELNNFLFTSSIYPAVVLGAVFSVVVFLFVFFIPRFGAIFTNLGKPVPTPTAVMLWISSTGGALWWLWGSCLLGTGYFIHTIRGGGKSRDWWDQWILSVPLLRHLVQTVEMSLFTRTLAILAVNQVHLLKAVAVGCRVIQNRTIAASMSGLAGDLKAGAKLSAALGKSPHVPKLVLQMLAVGEESGDAAAMLEQVAGQLEEQLRIQIKRLLALFEPLVIMFLAIIVASVVF